jgi:predicted nucleic acid binding AN1-type Zn finger protein
MAKCSFGSASDSSNPSDGSEAQKGACQERANRLTGMCRWCQHQFCGRHRLPEDHQCPNLHGCRQQSHDKNSNKLLSGKCVADKV